MCILFIMILIELEKYIKKVNFLECIYKMDSLLDLKIILNKFNVIRCCLCIVDFGRKS